MPIKHYNTDMFECLFDHCDLLKMKEKKVENC